MGQCVTNIMERTNNRKEVDFPVYKQYATYGKQCTMVRDTEKNDRSCIYRMANTSEEEHKRLCRDWSKGTCLQTVEKFCKERGKEVCLAYRNLITIEKTDVTDKNGRTKTMETYVFDEKRKTMSYELFWRNIVNFGKGLAELGLQKGDRVAIYEDTRWQWLNTMYSCWSQGLVVTTVYSNLGEDALMYALKETDCQAIVCNGSNVGKVVNIFRSSEMADVKIIYLDQLPSETDTGEYELFRWGDVMYMGKENGRDYFVPDESMSSEPALIMYTSGTTGNPKGVVHTHGSMYAGIRTISHRVEDILGPISLDEWYCSYLPMAHIMELAVLSVLMIRGVKVGFGSTRTLMDQFAKPHGDLTEFQPLLLVSVPRVFDTIKKAVEANLPKPGTVKRTIFDNAYASRLRALKEGKDTPYYNEKVFIIPRKLMGNRVYAMLSGGGPLSKETQEFVNVVFGLVVQGWGLTETVCVGTIQRTGNLQYDCAGQILKTEEVQLLDTEEFKHTDQPEPRGEVCLRGPFLFKEYYKQPELTKEALDEDGWFHTGDVGAMTSSGAIRLVGRVKALAKNSNGEYLALEALESIYGTNEITVANAVCVLVNPHRSYIAAIALTTETLVDNFKRKHKLTGKYPAILDDPEFQAKALKSFQDTARNAGRKSFEIIQGVKLLNEEWTPQNGVLTAAFKLMRRVVDTKYKDIIDELFAKD